MDNLTARTGSRALRGAIGIALILAVGLLVSAQAPINPHGYPASVFPASAVNGAGQLAPGVGLSGPGGTTVLSLDPNNNGVTFGASSSTAASAGVLRFVNGMTLQTRNAANSANICLVQIAGAGNPIILDCNANAGGVGIGSANPIWLSTAPTISSGFGTSPSIVSSNGTSSFRVNVGTGGVATSGVVGLPAAATGWNCQVTDTTNNTVTRETANSTTTVTVTAAAAWAASDVLIFACAGF